MKADRFALELPSGVTISPRLQEHDLAPLLPETDASISNPPGWLHIPEQPIGGTKVMLNLHFHQGRLESIHLAVSDRSLYGASWDGWAEAKEKQRAEDTKEWLSRAGYPPGTYPWGDVWTGYDTKGGSGGAVIRFRTES